MRSFWTDVRYGTRRLASRPGFLGVAVVTLALGIGANTALYSVVDALLLRPLPFPRPLVQLHAVTGSGFLVPSIGEEAFNEWRRQTDVFDSIEAYSQGSHVLAGAGEPRLLRTAALTGGLMPLIGAVPQLGRILQPADSEPGSHRVAVISDGLWREHLGGEPGAIGKTIQLNDQTYEIVGVMKRGFSFPYGRRDLWLPLVAGPVAPGARAPRYDTVATLTHGLSLEQAQTRIDAAAAALATERPVRGGWATRLRPFLERRVNAPVERALYILFAAVGVVLLIACANLANLLLVEGAGREREVAVRAALGAGRGRLVRQLLTETLLLAAAGGVAGIGLALWGVDLLAGIAPADLTFLSNHELAVDRRALLFAVGLTVCTALLFGIVPALRSSRAALEPSMRSSARSATGSARHQRLRNSFVVAQLALSLILLVAGGLLSRTFIGLTRVDPGFKAEGLVAASLSVPAWKYPTPPARREFYRAVMDRLRATPGVEGVTLAGGLPPGGGGISFGLKFEVEGRGVVLDDPNLVMPFADVEPDYFQILQIPLLAGRHFVAADGEKRGVASILNESMARRFWGEPHLAIGQRWRTGPTAPWRTVVGVAGDVYQFDHTKPRGTLAAYYPMPGEPSLAGQLTLVVRTATGVPKPLELVRQQIRSVDGTQAISELATVEDLYADFFSIPRFYALLMSVFAGIGACIAAVGLYGVLAYAVAQRTREFGIRVALGASREDVLRLALAQGARVTLAGLALGAAGSLIVTRGLASMLVGMSPADPLTYITTTIVLAVVAALASWVPSRRAAHVDPAVALRQE